METCNFVHTVHAGWLLAIYVCLLLYSGLAANKTDDQLFYFDTKTKSASESGD